MTPDRAEVYHPNLLCPLCKREASLSQLQRISTNSAGAAELYCIFCVQSYSPEDGFLTGLDSIPKPDYIGYPYALGSIHRLETERVEIGSTAIQNVIEPDRIEDVVLERVVPVHETEDPAQEIREDGYERYHPPAGFNEIGVGIALGMVPPTGTLHVITSSKEDSPYVPGDPFRVGYEYGIQVADIEDPPWVDYLAEASDILLYGNKFGAIPLIASAFENHLLRQLSQTLRAKGKSQSEVKAWFDKYRRRNGHLDLNKVIRKGMEDLTGVDIGVHGDNEYESFWHAYCGFKDIRDTEVIHLSYSDRTKDVYPSDVREHFDNMVDLMVLIHQLCWKVRLSIG